MDEARAVLDRLERIERLERAGAAAPVLLEHVRALLTEAEAWVRAERGVADGALNALDRCRAALAGGPEIAQDDSRTLVA
jgi:hypothetical protein